MIHRLRILAIALALAAVAVLPGPTHAAAATAVPFGTVLVPGATWAGSYASLGNLNVYSNGTGAQDQSGAYGPRYECTELAERWAAIAYGVNPSSWNIQAAWQMFAAASHLSIPFEALPNGGSAPPQFGDILVFDRTSFDPTGHVAVVSGVGPGVVDIVEQNWGDPSPTGSAQLPITGTTMPTRWGLTILGWMRPSSVPYVQSLYQDVLGRPADAAGLGYWTTAINDGLSRQAAALALENSAEGREDFVQAEYLRLLRRAVDPSGLAYWSAYLATHTVQQFEATIMGPPEYYDVEGGGTNAGFVTALYTDTLGRAPDPGGQAYFMSLLTQGESHEAIATAMVWSLEGLQHRVNIMYQTYLGRPADNGALAYYPPMLAGGLPVQNVAAMILGSAEYMADANAQ